MQLSRPGVAAPPDRPRLDLSGPKLAEAFATLVAGAEDNGGVERYVDALKLKSALFVRTLADGRARDASLGDFRAVCAWMPTVRRRIGPHVEPEAFAALRSRVAALVDGTQPTSAADARIGAFCAVFPDDRAHRWVRDLAAELIHHVDPERYPLMTRWMWDAGANTGVLREIWHGEDVDHMRIAVGDGYETFLVLREELAGFLAANGVYRDVPFYVDLLCARIYAGYIHEQGGTYLRADFASPEEPMLHVRRLLGLDGVAENGRTRLKAADGTAVVIDDPPRLD
jgi:hypothetical protein